MPLVTLKSELENSTNVTIGTAVRLNAHTSFAIGGPATFFAFADSTEALSRLIAGAKRLDLETLIIGGGTNLLVSDDGFDGLAIKMRLTDMDIDVATGVVRTQAGVPTARLVTKSVEQGLGGLAFAAGLPGTVGGALAGNAGCFGQCISDPLKEAQVVSPDGCIIRVKEKQWFDFNYRHSKLKENGHVITEATFALTPMSAADIQREASQNIALRKEKHPPQGAHTAGSYFKNLSPETPGGRRRAAGLLLDQVDAKGLRVGGAAVFERHANIIVNTGGATARDVLSLAKEMQRRVKERFGVLLEPEVRFVGRRPVGL